MTPRGAGGNCPLTIWLGCWLLLPCLLVWSLPTYGPETCDHLIGEGHLMKLQQLIDSQMETSCHITFKFADRDQLKDSICYLKKAFPLIQDIFEEIIRFKDNSSNYNASRDLHELYLRLRDAGCVTREHEERDEACVRTFNNTPVQILEKVQNIFVETNRLLKDDWRIFDRDCTSSFAKCVSSGPERQNMGSPVLQFQGSDFWVLIAGILLVLLAVGGLLFYKQRQRNRQELQPAEILLEQPEIRSPLNQEEDRQVEMPV
uniref:Colony stimulating factor 1 n=1 Tax=Sarcophilus harrisii TaxID=9305 RepID=A0A7N4Q087_SARHA